MSRSRRKVPIMGHCDSSDKEGKRFANRKYRKHVRMRIFKGIYEFENIRALYNVCEMPKDGKGYFGNLYDRECVKKLLRK